MLRWCYLLVQKNCNDVRGAYRRAPSLPRARRARPNPRWALCRPKKLTGQLKPPPPGRSSGASTRSPARRVFPANPATLPIAPRANTL